MCVPWRVRLRRYSIPVIWRRLRRPIRFWVHYRRAKKFCRPYVAQPLVKQACAQTVLAVGNFSETTGLSRAFRAELDILRDEYKDFNFRAVCLSHPRHDLPAPDRLILLCQPDTYQDILSRFAPAALKNTYRIGFAVWEMQAFPRQWRPYLSCMHEVYTPSEFSAAALRKGFSNTVTVRPHTLLPCQPLEDAAMSRQTLGVKDEDFLGLAIMDIKTCPDRKNPHGAILAWQKAFSDQKNKVLLLKVRFSRHTQIIREELLNLIAEHKNIRLVEEEMSDTQVRAFQSLADVYISLHRAEGYGLNIAEMLALGKPSVVTDWSGNTDFTRGHPLVYSVPATLIPYSDYLGSYNGTGWCLKWAEADIECAARHLKVICAATAHASCASQHLITA